MNSLRKGKFARAVLFIQRKSFISTKHKHTTMYKVQQICPHNIWEAHEKPKILQHCEVSVCRLQVTGGILSEFGPFCRRLWSVALYFGITSNPDCSVAQSSVSSQLRKDKVAQSIQTPRRLPHQTSGLWWRAFKGPPHPQLAHSLASCSFKNNQ